MHAPPQTDPVPIVLTETTRDGVLYQLCVPPLDEAAFDQADTIASQPWVVARRATD